jgi:alkylation response protein AidB-like acyl-CoA dehydrogenase
MTENAGGSDVSATETTAKEENGRWRCMAQVVHLGDQCAGRAGAGAAARRPAGRRQSRAVLHRAAQADGRWRNIQIDRLKQKLGTRELPTAEIHLHGTPAELVGEARHGVRAIARC